jgi:hypothetical protein
MPLISFFLLGEHQTVLLPTDPEAAALWPKALPPAALPLPDNETIISIAAYSGDWATVEVAVSYTEPDETAIENVGEVWDWIEAMLESRRGRPDEADRRAWNEVKWVLAAFEGVSSKAKHWSLET